jgi:hypothetical protein
MVSMIIAAAFDSGFHQRSSTNCGWMMPVSFALKESDEINFQYGFAQFDLLLDACENFEAKLLCHDSADQMVVIIFNKNSEETIKSTFSQAFSTARIIVSKKIEKEKLFHLIRYYDEVQLKLKNKIFVLIRD